MRKRPTTRFPKILNERGSTLVEVSLVLMLLLTMLFGMIEIGRLLLSYTTLATAVRAGARYAIVHGGDCTGVCGANSPEETVVRNLAAAGGLTAANLTVTVTYPAVAHSIASLVQVKAVYVYTPIVSLPPLNLLNPTLGSTTQGTICY